MAMTTTTFCRRLFLACMLWWLALAASTAQAQTAGGRPFRDTLGLVVKFQQGQPMTQLSTLEQLGVGWVRDTVMWADMEPSPGKYSEPPNAFKQRLAYYREHKIGVVFMLAYANHGAYPATKEDPFAPVNPKAMGRYAVHMAKVLREAGVNFVLEVWNEPHNFVLGKMVGGQWNGKPPSPWVDLYMDMVREVVTQVKKVDPQTKVINCEDVWVAHYWFMEHGLPAALDGFGIHPYAGGNSPGPEATSLGEKIEWAMPFQLVDRDRSLISGIRRLKDQGLKKMGKKPEIWITEFGWSVGAKSPEGPVTEDMIADFLPRSFIVSAAAGVEALLWFSSQDVVDGPMGLIDNRGRRRPAFKAFQVMSGELGNLVLTRQLTGAATPISGVQAYLFTSGSVQKVAIWSADNQKRRLKVDGGWTLKKAVTAMGEDLSIKGEGNAKTLTIGAQPLYLTLGGSESPVWSKDLIVQ